MTESFVAEKLKDALNKKFEATRPCSIEAWHEYLAECGIDATPQPTRARIFRVVDPMGVYTLNAAGDAVGKKHDLLSIPEEVAMKVLVLGLP